MPEQAGIFYTDKGSGIPLLFIHGFCETQEIWKTFSDPFSKNYRVLCIDLPGFGRSELLKPGFTISEVASHILNWLDVLQIHECISIGHSLGGYVTLAMVEQRPEKFKAFGLFHSTAFADTGERRQSRDKVIEFVSRHGVLPFVESFIPPLFYDQANLHISSVVKLASQTRSETLLSYVRAMRDRPDTTHVLSEFKKPVLFLTGEMDSGITLDSIQKQAALAAKPTIHLLHSIAHMGMFESENLAVEKIQQFLKKVA